MNCPSKKVAASLITIVQLTALLVGGIPDSFAKGVDPEEKVEYYLYDHLGGVDAVLDEQGNVVERKDYLPYGEERVDEATGNGKERHGFTGKELDDESGLYYYGARYYDPTLGRFISQDPMVLDETEKSLSSVLSDPQQLNVYAYASNNPLRYLDPDGKFILALFPDPTQVQGVAYGQEYEPAEISTAEKYTLMALGSLATGVSAVTGFEDIYSGIRSIFGLGRTIGDDKSTSLPGTQSADISAGNMKRTIRSPQDIVDDAEALSKKTGKYKVEINTVEGKTRYDLKASRGAHFDKATQAFVDAPHVHEYALNANPNYPSQCGYEESFVRTMNRQDVRTVEKFLEKGK